MDKDKILKLTEYINQLIDKHIQSDRRKEDFNKFFDEYADEYFSLPGSPTKDNHDCCVGGLALHSYTVTMNALKINNNALKLKDVTNEQIVTVGLLHDVGKIGDGEERYYIPEESEWHRLNQGRMYNINRKVMGMRHEGISIYLLMNLNFKLSKEEFQAILFHCGQYSDFAKNTAMREYDLTLLLQSADRISIQGDVNYKIGREE